VTAPVTRACGMLFQTDLSGDGDPEAVRQTTGQHGKESLQIDAGERTVRGCGLL
jgi:hypothetical protein